MSRLVVNPNTAQAWEIKLKPGTNLLGRGFANDFKIDDPSVSSSHCQIVIGNDAVMIRDLGSTNGTFVNQSQVQESRLETGHAIRLGGVEMVFYSDAREPVQVHQVPPTVPGAAPGRVVVIPNGAPARPVVVPAGAPAVPVMVPGAAPALPVAQLIKATPVAASDTAPAIPIPIPIAPPMPAAPVAPRLSIAGHKPATVATVASAAVAEDAPPMEPPVAPAIASGPRYCKFHPKSIARWVCNKCNRTFCDLCVATRTAGGGTTKKACRSCGVDVFPLEVTYAVAVRRSFYALLPGAFVYPFLGMGWFILLIAAFVSAALDMLSFGITWIFAHVFFYGFFFLFMQNILFTTAADEKETMGLPSADGILGGLFQLVGTIAASFGLPLALLGAKLNGTDIPTSALIGTSLLGCLFFPMSFLAVAMKDTLMAANPLIVVPSIMKAPVQYLVVCMLLVAVLGMRVAGGLISGVAGSVTFETKEVSTLLMALGFQGIWKLVSVYLMTVCIRFLGLFYISNKEKLGWF